MPKLLKTPFAIDAAEGFRTDIQESTGAAPNSATYQVGFPPVTMQSIASNGMPPKGSDLNGVLYDITDNLVFLTQGGGYGFDSAYATSIGGYPLNARLRLANGDIVKSTIDGNVTDPNVDMAGWEFDNSPNSIITVDSVAEMLALRALDGLTVKTKSYNAPNYSLKNPFVGGMIYTYNSSRSLENDGGSVINGWVAQFPQYNEVNVDWFGADPNADLTSVDSTIQIEKACEYLSNVLDSGDEGDNEVGKILYSAGVYIQGDIKTRSYIKYEGAGTLATRLQPKTGYSWVFDTEGTSSIQVGVPKPPRLYGTNIHNLMIGCGKYSAEVAVPQNVGGINLEYSNYIDLSSVYIRHVDGNGLRIKEGMDSAFDNLRLMNCGNVRDAENPVFALDVIKGESDLSNALRFNYPHIEQCAAPLRFENTRHCVVQNIKIEGGNTSSRIYSNTGLIFDNPELTWSQDSTPMFDIKNGAVGDSAGVVFNIPQCISGSTNKGWYFKTASAGGFTEIIAPFMRNINTLIQGAGFVVRGGTGYACGNSLLKLEGDNCKATNLTLLAQIASTATDGSDDTIIITGANCEVSDCYITSQNGSSSDGGAFINALTASSPSIQRNKFGGSRQYGIRSNSSGYKVRDNEIIGSGIGSILSNIGVKPNFTLTTKSASGFGVGGVNSSNITVASDATATMSGIVAGGSLLNIRCGNSGALVFTDSAVGSLAIVSSVGALVFSTGTGVSGDGKVYLRASGVNLVIENRSASSINCFACSVSAVM